MFIKQFFVSFFSYFSAICLLVKKNLWKYIIIPGMLSFALVVILLLAGSIYSADISTFFLTNIFQSADANGFLKVVLNIFITVIIFIIGILIYRPFALVLLSPFLSVLSEKTENLILTGENKTAPGNVLTDLQRSIRINIRFFLFSAVYSLGAVASGLLPVVGSIISTVLLFFIQAYYGGCGLADIILERHGLAVNDRLRFIKNNRALIMASGSGFLLLLFIPIVGWFIAPGLGTIATTISLTKIDK